MIQWSKIAAKIHRERLWKLIMVVKIELSTNKQFATTIVIKTNIIPKSL